MRANRPLLVVAILGIALSSLLLVVARRLDEDRILSILEFRAEWRAGDFEAKIRNSAFTVGNLAAFAASQEPVTAGDFHRFVRKQQSVAPTRALHWVPYVTRDERARFEFDARTTGMPQFSIMERDAAGAIVVAGERDRYFPVWLSERFENQSAISGLDLYTNPDFARLIDRSRDSGQAVAASAIRADILPLSRTTFQVLWPVYSTDIVPETLEERRISLRGFAMGNFRIESVLLAAVKDTPRILEQINFFVDAPAIGGTGQPAAIYMPHRGFSADLDVDNIPGIPVSRQFEILGQRWTLVSIFPHALIAELRSWAPLALFSAGLLLTALIVMYMARQQAVQRSINSLVAARTSDLMSANTALNREIAERQHAEQALQQQAETLAATLETLPVGIIHLNPRKNILFWSHTAEQIFGYSAGEILGEPFGLTVEDERASFNAMLDSIIAGKVVRNHPVHAVKKDGSQLAISFSGAALYGHGELRGIVGILEDVSQRLSLESELLQSQKMEALGQLTGGMAHDFNNLLMVIMGNLQLVMDLAEDQKEIFEFATEAYKATERGADLIRSLLAFARRQPLRPRQIDVNEVVSGVTKMLSRILGEKVDITLETGRGLWPVKADPVQVEAALTNLATNARDAMPRGGRLTIATRNRHLDETYVAQHPEAVPGDYVMLQVSDTGTGIPPETLARIFEPFYTTKDRGRGTGLGLSMVFGFMKQSGGHINVYSEVGVGTTFRLYLPRHHDAAAEGSTAGQKATARGGSETILVVEDDPAIRRLVLHELDGLGYRTLEADNGSKALSLLEGGQHIDLVFTDIVMAGKLDGLDLARLIPARWPHVKVVLTSGFPDTKVGDEMDGLDGVHLLSKPYRKSELAHVLRAVLDGRPPGNGDD